MGTNFQILLRVIFVFSDGPPTQSFMNDFSCTQETILNFQIIKVAHHSWIKFLKSRQNSLMMKIEETYDRYECTKNK